MSILSSTSVNQNEPVVWPLREALDCFLWTRMVLLVRLLREVSFDDVRFEGGDVDQVHDRDCARAVWLMRYNPRIRSSSSNMGLS